MLALVVTFNLDGLSDQDFRTACEEQWAEPVAAMMPGLVAKTWLADAPNNTYGGSYLFEDEAALASYQQSAFFSEFTSDPRIANISAQVFEVLDAPSRMTNGIGGAVGVSA